MKQKSILSRVATQYARGSESVASEYKNRKQESSLYVDLLFEYFFQGKEHGEVEPSGLSDSSFNMIMTTFLVVLRLSFVFLLADLR